jgi:hypothetical protein
LRILHGNDFRLHRPRLLDHFHRFLDRQRMAGEGDRGKAKYSVRADSSNPAWHELLSNGGLAFAAAVQ